MTWLETLRTGFEAVRTHRMRSALTVLGIAIGVAAVTLTFGLGQGARDRVRAEISSLGTNVLTVTPGSARVKGAQGGLGTAKTLTRADAAALGNGAVAPDVAAVAPVAQASIALTWGRHSWKAPVLGTTPSWAQARHRSVAAGRFLDRQDVARTAAVAVLGPTVVARLFRGVNPLGKTIRVGAVPVTVVGVLGSVGASSTATAASQDDEVVVPLSTAVERIFYSTSLSSILVDARSTALLSAAYQEVDAELLALEGSPAPSTAGFTISTPQSLVSTAVSVNRTLTDLLAGIAGIALLVGGIGVMNIMLMSVTERIHEIGLRKALGATPRLIRRQFLVEAAMLGAGGAAVGLLAGLSGTLGLPGAIGAPIALSLAAVGAALGVAFGVALLSGVYPAARAARLAPIDALRTE
ncbi:MAG: ABC transporter permease [Acidimicrobiales bacterium]